MQCNACHINAQGKCLTAVSKCLFYTQYYIHIYLYYYWYYLNYWKYLHIFFDSDFEFYCVVLLLLTLKTSLHCLSTVTKTVQGHFATPLTHSMSEAVQSRVQLIWIRMFLVHIPWCTYHGADMLSLIQLLLWIALFCPGFCDFAALAFFFFFFCFRVNEY